MNSSLNAHGNLFYHKKAKLTIGTGLVLLLSLSLTSILIVFPSSTTFRIIPKQELNQRTHRITPTKDDNCDLFMGRWVQDPRGSVYTNKSCPTLPDSKDCAKYGRVDKDYLYWRWKPDGCKLPKFEPEAFLRILRGKKLAFIGDSVARNHVDSLLCLLSQVESPTDVYKDAENKFQTWIFPSHNLTIMVLWSEFLVVGIQRVTNEPYSMEFDLHVDKVDVKWTEKLPGADYAIISVGHWFFKKNYIHQSGNLIGCYYCNDVNVTDLGLGFAYRRVFRTALRFINSCKECGEIVTFLRTFSPAHFENGTWDHGGNCERTSPLREEEVNLEGTPWELRNIQLEEVGRASEEGRERGKRFEALDVTKAMLYRADGHPGSRWFKAGTGLNDCVHWCLPGPIDMWNDLLLAVLKRVPSLP